MDTMDLGRLVRSDLEKVVAVEYDENAGKAELFLRQEDGSLASQYRPFQPFLLTSGEALASQLLGTTLVEPLAGEGVHRFRVSFSSKKTYDDAVKKLKTLTGLPPSSPLAPYRVFSDMTQQLLTRLNIRLFRGLDFGDLRRMQLDIETKCAPGHHFSNPDSPEDEVILVSLIDTTGFEVCLSNKEEGGEAALLNKMISLIRLHDPDVIEGHNIFNFDLTYLEKRCKRHKIPFALGRGGRIVKSRASRFTAGERSINYQRFDIYGRHVIDTYFLVILYDIAHRELESHGLKACARYFNVAAPNRTYVQGEDISKTYDASPEVLKDYCLDDVRETDGLSRILSPSFFYQSQLVPFSYQNCVLRGNATRIDALLCAEYLSRGIALPTPQAPSDLMGALSESMVSGVFHNVWHIDVRSLYPSVISSEHLTPASDTQGIFLELLSNLRQFRLAAKDAMRNAEGAERENLNALQSSFKILINSFYGYTAFTQGTFNDFTMASRITLRGREILSSMRDFLMTKGAVIIEMDTDGIYFTPPAGVESTEAMRESVQSILPEGIEVDLDATYVAMFSYKAKNYALLDSKDSVKISGAALKSRGLEPFQRRFIREVISLLLHSRSSELSALRDRYENDITLRRLPLADFVQKEYLSESPQSYADKLAKGTTRRSAAYEVALTSDKEYKMGDSVEYYVTGAKKRVVVADNCVLYEGKEPETRNENIEFYLDKLNQLYAKFVAAVDGDHE
ncbi:MAG: hypothetical protein J6X55_08225 [Victivallales bacterium]|nr:hypothetical protein [Victivallales bacterium]